jgi:hypothetical protein
MNSDLHTLSALEHEMEGLVRDFRRIGEILKEIRDKRLYLEIYPDFEVYCEERWHFTRQRAQQFIDAFRLDTELEGMVENESQARSLLSVKNPNDRQIVAYQARELTKKEDVPLSKAIKLCVEEYKQKSGSTAKNKYPGKLVKKLQYLFCLLNEAAQRAFLLWANNYFRGNHDVLDAAIINDDPEQESNGEEKAPANDLAQEMAEDPSQLHFDWYNEPTDRKPTAESEATND